MAEKHREVIQRQIHQDWANREYIEVIANSIKKITAFLNSFGKKHKKYFFAFDLQDNKILLLNVFHSSDMSCRSRLAALNEKLTTLERRIDYLEACINKDDQHVRP